MAECSSQEKTPTTPMPEAATSASTSGKPAVPLKPDKTQESPTSVDDSENLKAASTVVSSVSTPLLIEEIDGENVPISYTLLLEALAMNKSTSSDTATPTSSEDTNPLHNLNKYDIIVIFIYIIMLEQGFIPLQYFETSKFDLSEVAKVSRKNENVFSFDKQRVNFFCANFPKIWQKITREHRGKNLYDASFILGEFMKQRVRILCTICMDDLLVNCSIESLSESNCSMLIDPAQYVIDSRTSLQKRFQHVRQFSTKFKNDILIPVKLAILQVHRVQTSSLQDLPPELKMELQKLVNVDFFNDL